MLGCKSEKPRNSGRPMARRELKSGKSAFQQCLVRVSEKPSCKSEKPRNSGRPEVRRELKSGKSDLQQRFVRVSKREAKL